MRVLRRPVAGDARPAGCVLVLLAFSVVFTATAVPALPGLGAVLYLIVGVAGVLLCAAVLLTAAGRFLGRRPVLELDAHGVRLPAPWPLPRARDRCARWADVAAVVLWSSPAPHGRRALTDQLAFLPAPGSAGPAAPSAELLALHLDDLPGLPSTRWAIRLHPGWDADPEEILAEVRRRGLPAVDARTR
jgi:membrane protease YdiL (CAAX protease family)